MGCISYEQKYIKHTRPASEGVVWAIHEPFWPKNQNSGTLLLNGTHKESAAQDKQWSGAQAGLTAKAVKLKVLLRRNAKDRKSCK